MSEPNEPEEQSWELGWDGHALAQRRRLARLPLAEKLQWLEEAGRLVEQLARSARERGIAPQADAPSEDSAGD